MVLMFKCVGFRLCRRIWPHQNSLHVDLNLEPFITAFKLYAKYCRYLVLELQTYG